MEDSASRDLSSVGELLGRAVGILATGSGPIHDRLAEAWTEVILAHRYLDSLPAPIAGYFGDIWRTLHGPDGASSIRALTTADAQHLARKILELDAIVEDYDAADYEQDEDT